MPKLYETGVAPAITVNPFSIRSAIRYDSALGTARWGLLNDLLGTFVVDPHSRVSSKSLAGPPISERESVALTSGEKLSSFDHAKLVHAWEVSQFTVDRAALFVKGLPTLALAALFAFAAIRRRRKLS